MKLPELRYKIKFLGHFVDESKKKTLHWFGKDALNKSSQCRITRILHW